RRRAGGDRHVRRARGLHARAGRDACVAGREWHRAGERADRNVSRAGCAGVRALRRDGRQGTVTGRREGGPTMRVRGERAGGEPTGAGPATRAPELAIAFDVATLEAALALDAALGPGPELAKVGLELFTGAGPESVRALRARGRRVFLDLKLHDIPHT